MTEFLCASVFEDVDLNGAGIAILVSMLAFLVLVTVAVNVVPRLIHKWEIVYRTRDITYGAACLALSFALSWAGVRLPNGGTITVAALAPVFIYCYYFGLRKGMVVSTAYMLLQFLQFPSIVSPWSAFFDYILPYYSLCIVGVFCYKPQRYSAFVKRNKDDGDGGAANAFKRWGFTIAGHWGIFVGAAIHMLIRYVSQTASGVLNYELWYGPGFAFSYKLLFSLGYNAYGMVDSAITVGALVIILSSRAFNSYMTAGFTDKSALKAATAPAASIADSATDNCKEPDVTACADAFDAPPESIE